jgi:uncharacterized protein
MARLVPPYMTMAMRISRWVSATRSPPFVRVWVLTTPTPKAWVGGFSHGGAPCRAAVVRGFGVYRSHRFLPNSDRALRLRPGTLPLGGAAMVRDLDDRLDAIRAACERFRVVRLDVFGSVLRDDFEPGRSDVDLLVDFGPMSPFEKPDAYFGLLDELRTILGADVDLVMVGALKNRYIRDDVDRTKRVVYAA